ncbi:MAG TPA: metallophosphoesterase, partial [Thermoanaerobaculia bacterium]|nr:metallophosphoesterase [Thermoanaerobaculia bacterium]
MKKTDRRSFLRIAGVSIGAGALYRAAPLLGAGREGAAVAAALREANGEAPRPFTFVQLSDTHVGFEGPPDPLGTRAFERAVESINALAEAPDLVLFTGDLTHDTENAGEHAERMKRFREIAGRLRVKNVRCVPGEHDAGLDGGALFREHFGPTSYSFDHRGVHFVALDNVSNGKPEVGQAQRAWLEKDLSRFGPSAPIVVFTHRPLFDLKPEWEWFTDDGDRVMNALSRFENVTVLYGHIHRADHRTIGGAAHHGARSLVFAFPDPASGAEKKPLPFSTARPFANLGIRKVAENGRGGAGVDDVELTTAEFAGTNGIQQLLKKGV